MEAVNDNKKAAASLCVTVVFRKFISSLELNGRTQPPRLCVRTSRKTLPHIIILRADNQIVSSTVPFFSYLIVAPAK